MEFDITELGIPGVKLIQPLQPFADNRGVFVELWRNGREDFDGLSIVQMNVSASGPFVLRGMHYQQAPQAKLLTCVFGRVYQVSLDMRRGSKTYGKWTSIHLDSKLHNSVFVPMGFANGFMTFEDGAILHYCLLGREYDPAKERAVNAFDQDVGINWPVRGIGGALTMSRKDREAPKFKEAEGWTP